MSALMCVVRFLYRYLGFGTFSATTITAVGPSRISIGRPESITNGRPIRLHHRIACASRMACRVTFAGVTVGSSLARGILRLSYESSQFPEMPSDTATAGGPAGAWGACASALIPTLANIRQANGRTKFIHVPRGELVT